MDPEIRAFIEQHYHIHIQKCISGPRQFVAETYILTDNKSHQYFCKLINKSLFIQGILQTLNAVEQMHDNGIERICYPLRGTNGLHFSVGDTLIVLFNYIPALQSFDYDLYTLGSLIAQIHHITPQLTVDVPKEQFEFLHHELFNTQFEHILNSQESDLIIQKFQALLRTHEKEIRDHLAKFIQLKEHCRKHFSNFVITHGDIKNNVLVKSSRDIYIVDWDELRLALAERDLWMMDQHQQFIDGYKNVRPDFVANSNIHSFYILQYYFERIMYYFAEILNEANSTAYRLERIQKLAQGRMAGWFLSKIEEITHPIY